MCTCPQVDFAAARAPFADRKRKADVQVDPGTGKAIRTGEANETKDELSAPRAGSAAAARAGSVPARETGQPHKQERAARGGEQPPAGAVKGRPKKREKPTGKQQLVMTVAVGGIPPGLQSSVLKLAGAAGKVGDYSTTPLFSK